jgi:exopolysaccharide biosynthesis polyprenyl glycosylphosphotransferase
MAESEVLAPEHVVPTGMLDARRPEWLDREIPESGPTAATAARDALYRRLLAVADVFSAAFAFTVAIPVLGDDSLGILAVVAVLMIVLVCKLTGLYDRDEHLLRKTTLDEAPALFRVAALYTLLAFLAGTAIVDGPFGSDQAAALWALLFISMLITRTIARRIAGAIAPEERCVILGTAEAGHWLSSKLERSHATRVRIVGRVPLNPNDQSTNELSLLGSFEQLGLLLAEHDVDRVVLAPGMADADHMLDGIRIVKALGVRVSVLPRMFEVVGAAVEFDDIEGASLLGVRPHGLSRSSRLLKRALDVTGATIGLLLIAPLLAMIAVAIKLDSRGPVFFRQPRMGRDDTVFKMLKFRTMVDGADRQREQLADRNEAEGGLFKIEDDPRITRVGRFLRRTSLDELPQLFNVLRGDMSLVGPRPLVLDEDRQIEGWYRRRLLLLPGMTGLWQVFGSARVPMSEMVKIDYLYGANWSLWLDVKILLRTVPFMLGRRGL